MYFPCMIIYPYGSRCNNSSPDSFRQHGSKFDSLSKTFFNDTGTWLVVSAFGLHRQCMDLFSSVIHVKKNTQLNQGNLLHNNKPLPQFTCSLLYGWVCFVNSIYFFSVWVATLRIWLMFLCRCRFDVDLTDETGTVTASIFGELAE